MRLGVRSKLFFASVALIVLAGGVSTVWLETNLRSWLDTRTEDELVRYTRSLSETLRVHETELTSVELDAHLERLGEVSGFRVTFIDAEGTVLGDSQVPFEALSTMDKHDTRPEVVAALADGVGRARRYSQTIGRDMLYVAVAVEPVGDRASVVRVAMSLSETYEVTRRLRTFLLFAGGLGLLLALLMSGLAAHLMARALKALVGAAEDLAEGRTPPRFDTIRRDELGTLATYMDRLASELQGQVERVVGSRDRFAAVLEAIDAAVIALDDRRRVTMVNAAAEALLELPPEPIGRPLDELIRVPALHALLDRTAGFSTGFEEIELGFDVPRYMLARVAPFRTSEGAVLVLHDVSRLRHLETVRRDFVANVSHELRTPLSIILANTELLLDGALEDEAAARKFLASMHRSARRLTALVSDLLDLSRIEGGSHTLSPEAVVVADVVSNVFESVRGLTTEKGISVNHTVADDVIMMADPAALEQVILNFVDNALKYTEPGGSIEVRTTQGERRVRLEVIDDGPGVAESHRQRLFERFYRVDPGRSRDQGGTGLGLAIVKHLVNSMGGDVGMTSSESGGALFWFDLPAHDAG
ncbi:MAG: ATP-binding protein [Myxococcota bacterium]